VIFLTFLPTSTEEGRESHHKNKFEFKVKFGLWSTKIDEQTEKELD